MAKDPAFLFYPGDWLGGTITFSRFLKGCYMDLLMAQFNSGHLSLEEIKTVLGSDFGQAWPALRKKFATDQEGLFFNERLEVEKNRRSSYTESRSKSRLKADEDQVRIYLILDKDSGNHKIGSSVNPKRRFLEMCNQINPAITLGKRDYSLVYVSDITERTTEKALHNNFKSKKISGEWFSLNENDIQFILKTYGGTYEIRTENENINKDKIEKEGVQGEYHLREKIGKWAYAGFQLYAHILPEDKKTELVRWLVHLKEKDKPPGSSTIRELVTDFDNRSLTDVRERVTNAIRNNSNGSLWSDKKIEKQKFGAVPSSY